MKHPRFAIRRLSHSIVLIAMLIGAALPAQCGQNAANGKNVVNMGNISIFKQEKQIRIKARVAIDKGILEYLLVEDHGKAYESAFKVADSLPSELNFGLLLIGCEPLEYTKLMELTRTLDGEKTLLSKHKDSLVAIDYYRNGEKVEMSSVIQDRENNGRRPIWVYTGGRFAKRNNKVEYVSDKALSHIGIWPDPNAVINMFSTKGNPYRGEFGFQVNQGAKGVKQDIEFEIVISRFGK